MLAYNDYSANGNNPLNSVSRSKGAVHRRMLEAVERRTIRGRLEYAILLLLVTYGLWAHEVARLTLDDIE
jgi:hypothetical protein